MTTIRRDLLATALAIALPTSAVYADEAASQSTLNLESAAVATDELAEQRGRENVDLLMQSNDSDQEALLSNNVSNGPVNTGTNFIDNGSFSGAQGLTTVIQNTGNHVIIQETTQINVVFTP